MRLNVNLPEHPYDIIIKKGSLSQVGQWISQLWHQQKVVLVTDDNVDSLYGRKVASQLRNVGFEVSTFTFPAG